MPGITLGPLYSGYYLYSSQQACGVAPTSIPILQIKGPYVPTEVDSGGTWVHVTPRPMHFSLNRTLLLGSLFCLRYSSKPWLVLITSPSSGSRQACGCPGSQLGQIRSYIHHQSCKGKFWLWAWPVSAGSAENPLAYKRMHIGARCGL